MKIWFLGGQKVAIKIFSNLDENLDIIEEEFRIFKDLSRHDNFPTFYGAFFNKYDKDFKNELWLVMEVSWELVHFFFQGNKVVSQLFITRCEYKKKNSIVQAVHSLIYSTTCPTITENCLNPSSATSSVN